MELTRDGRVLAHRTPHSPFSPRRSKPPHRHHREPVHSTKCAPAQTLLFVLSSAPPRSFQQPALRRLTHTRLLVDPAACTPCRCSERPSPCQLPLAPCPVTWKSTSQHALLPSAGDHAAPPDDDVKMIMVDVGVCHFKTVVRTGILQASLTLGPTATYRCAAAGAGAQRAVWIAAALEESVGGELVRSGCALTPVALL
jgi:hypothetical protein